MILKLQSGKRGEGVFIVRTRGTVAQSYCIRPKFKFRSVGEQHATKDAGAIDSQRRKLKHTKRTIQQRSAGGKNYKEETTVRRCGSRVLIMFGRPAEVQSAATGGGTALGTVADRHRPGSAFGLPELGPTTANPCAPVVWLIGFLSATGL